MLAIHIQPRWDGEIGALAAEANPPVETGLGLIAPSAHMPLAEEARSVTCLLQVFGEEAGSRRNWGVIVDNFVLMGVLAGEDRSTAGRAERRRDEGVLAVDSLARHRIHVWGHWELLGLHETHRVVAMVVRENEQDIAALAAGRSDLGSGGAGTKGRAESSQNSGASVDAAP